MIIVRMVGGLGNQLFQYAFGRYLSLVNNDEELYLDSTQPILQYLPHAKFILDKYQIKGNIIVDKIFREGILNNLPFGRYREDPSDINLNAMSAKGNIYLNGYWQSDMYFKHKWSIIKNDIILKEPITNDKFLNVQDNIKQTNSLSIHVRRNDYLTKPAIEEFYQYGVDYIEDAYKIVWEKDNNVVPFIFSDDIQWCKENLKHLNKDTTFVDLGQPGWMDLELMRNCKHFIIPNSTFAWWGAMLSENKDKIVIMPKRWSYQGNDNLKQVKRWISI